MTAELREEVHAAARRARVASEELVLATRERKDAALREMAAALRERSGEIVKANTADLEAGRAAGLPENMLDRLTLNEQRIGGVADGLLTVAGLA
ncbi:MAG: gamma-glutamyl-phosphate reductase, partial [Umezawaea sp.]